jgi:ribosomal protein L37AE/L43A
MQDSIGASFNDAKVSSIQNNLGKFQTHIRYSFYSCEDCRNEQTYLNSDGIWCCTFCVALDGMD